MGDSRAVMSYDYGAKAVALSRDHKPDDDDERNRIQSLGGKVYQYGYIDFSFIDAFRYQDLKSLSQ